MERVSHQVSFADRGIGSSHLAFVDPSTSLLREEGTHKVECAATTRHVLGYFQHAGNSLLLNAAQGLAELLCGQRINSGTVCTAWLQVLRFAHTHTHTHARTHARTHTHAHTHTHTHAHTHAHARTHTHACTVIHGLPSL